MSKKILYHNDATQALEKGMNILAQAVGVSLGPKGRNIVLDNKFGVPQIVNDGMTIAKAIELPNHFENIGVELIRQATAKTNEIAGDGTTTATVLAYAIVKEGLKNIRIGHNPMLIKKGLEKAVNFLIDRIAEYSHPVEDINDILHVASISSGNNIAIGNIITEAMEKVGREGLISLEESNSISTHLEFKQGMRFDKGFMSPYFIANNMDTKIVQDNPLILLTDKKITLVQKEIIPLLEKVATAKRSLMIIAEDIEKEALATLILNKLKSIIDVVAVRAPAFGDRKKAFLEDLAVITSGKVISTDLGLDLEDLDLNLMGSAKRVIVSKDTTTIIVENSKEIVKCRCNQIRKQIETSNNNYEKEKLQERLLKLSGNVALIKIGASTEIEMKNKKLRFEDAINATKAALEEGIVPGGGSTLVHLSVQLISWANQYLTSEELIGAQILSKALFLPLATIVKNNGMNGLAMVEYVKNTDFAIGYDANNDIQTDMYNAGIIDPAKVTRSVLQNASSIASIILTTDCIISDSLV